MPIGTEFEVEYKDGFVFEDSNTVRLNGLLDGKELTWLNGEKATCGSKFIDSIFIPIQQPVSFMEVVNSDKKCRVEHPIINSRVLNGSTMNLCLEAKEMKEGKCLKLNWILYIIGYSVDSEMLRTVIKEGKWYIEESEELEDERLS